MFDWLRFDNTRVDCSELLMALINLPNSYKQKANKSGLRDDDKHQIENLDSKVDKYNDDDDIMIKKSLIQPSSKAIQKYAGRINLNVKSEISIDKYEKLLGQSLDFNRIRIKDKSDRATVEQALDVRTRMILYKLLNKAIIDEISGCISTGKEANVYHAATNSGQERAIKVYKTSILVFKDRERYVTGEFRFRRKAYCKSNPRKMVTQWAEKEFRNLNRLVQSSIPCPTPIKLNSHVIVMSFLGKDGYSLPKLKDAIFECIETIESCFKQSIFILHEMYHKAKLVHADYSEYNILYHPYEQKLYVIDVSQSIEHDHPKALDFLKRDCSVIMNFFSRNGQPSIPLLNLFNLVTDQTLAFNEKIWSDNFETQYSNFVNQEKNNQQIVDEQVFKSVTIPRTLHQATQTKDEQTLMFAATTVGLNEDMISVKIKPDVSKNIQSLNTSETVEGDEIQQISISNSEQESESADSLSNLDEETAKISNEKSHMSKEELKKLRKENKVKVKEENRLKRQSKVPKNIKKAIENGKKINLNKYKKTKETNSEKS